MIALISAANKRGIENVARELAEIGFEILATDGTASYLRRKEINVRRVSEITGLTERRELKTLHHRLYEMIFSGQISVVIVIPYEFSAEPKFENIDIGGICLLRAAAKAGCFVAFDMAGCRKVVEAIKTGSENLKRAMLREVFRFTSEYDKKIVEWLENEASGI